MRRWELLGMGGVGDTQAKRERGCNSRAAFGRMLAWLREPSQIGAKVEIAALILRSKGERLGSAQVELNFWTIDHHDQPAAK